VIVPVEAFTKIILNKESETTLQPDTCTLEDFKENANRTSFQTSLSEFKNW
jgi:hypothetical protein